MTVYVYVEGGGETKPLRTACHKGFSTFFQKAGLKGRMPRVVVCGSREAAWKRFRSAFNSRTDEEVHLLLVDSEDSVTEGSRVWTHLKQRDNWDRPEGADDGAAHLMVQCMESWFLADVAALKDHFGNGFKESKLPELSPATGIEAIPKLQVFDSLKQATQETKTKDRYDKGNHSFQILAKLDAGKVIAASSRAAKLIEVLKGQT